MFDKFRVRRKLARLVGHWIEFQRVWSKSAGAVVVSDEQERSFLELKARISRLLTFIEGIVPPAQTQETAKHVRGMTQMMNEYRALGSEEERPEEFVASFEERWHDHFLFLNRLAGAEFGRPPQPAPARALDPPPRPRPVPTGMPELGRFSTGRAWLGPAVRTLLALGLFVFFGYLILVMLGSRWEAAARLTPGGAADLGWLSDTAVGLWNRLPGGISDFLSPIGQAYGIEVTIALFGVLLLSIAYWIFVRGR